METSIYLARLMGPIYLVLGTGMLLHQAHFRSIVKEVEASPALFYLSGVLALVFGGLIVLLNNVWTGWPVVITVLGWLAVLKGMVRVLFPAQAKEMVGRLVASESSLTAAGVVALALGAFLTAMGNSLLWTW